MDRLHRILDTVWERSGELEATSKSINQNAAQKDKAKKNMRHGKQWLAYLFGVPEGEETERERERAFE